MLLPAGSAPGDCDLTIEMFKRVFKTLQVELLGVVTAKAYDEGDVLKDEVAMKQICELAHQVVLIK